MCFSFEAINPNRKCYEKPVRTETNSDFPKNYEQSLVKSQKNLVFTFVGGGVINQNQRLHGMFDTWGF